MSSDMILGLVAIAVIVIIIAARKIRGPKKKHMVPPPSGHADGKVFCVHCGKQIPADSNFCEFCGKTQQ